MVITDILIVKAATALIQNWNISRRVVGLGYKLGSEKLHEFLFQKFCDIWYVL